MFNPLPQPLLHSFNETWSERRRLATHRLPPPWWTRGLPLNGEIRANYQALLPVEDFLRDLRHLALAVLPAAEFLPRILKTPPTRHPESLPDLWRRLPAAFANRVTFATEEFPALLCALADPPRFGTDIGRYPRQMAALTAFFDHRRGQALSILDLGCGTGHNTWEIANRANERTRQAPFVVGMTIEPLEAWMARNACLPHDPAREARLRSVTSAGLPVHFVAGDIRKIPSRTQWDLVVSNGLIGGDGLSKTDYPSLCQTLATLAAPRAGGVAVADAFHDGREVDKCTFADSATRCNLPLIQHEKI